MDGTLAGDSGFDPLKLGADGQIEQYRVAEVIHARWAMLAIPGIVIPEALGIPGGVWTETGTVFLDGATARPEILRHPYLLPAPSVALLARLRTLPPAQRDAPARLAPPSAPLRAARRSRRAPTNTARRDTHSARYGFTRMSRFPPLSSALFAREKNVSEPHFYSRQKSPAIFLREGGGSG